LPFARRGYRILCVEIGESLATVARRNLSPYPQVEVCVGSFEDHPVEERAFDLVVSATAFHWLDPSIAYPKCARTLRPGGAIALFWNTHVHSEASGGFFKEAQEIYRCEAPEFTEEDWRLPRYEEIPDRATGIEGTGLFEKATA
jgi:SAM-dependent methyltransferase